MNSTISTVTQKTAKMVITVRIAVSALAFRTMVAWAPGDEGSNTRGVPRVLERRGILASAERPRMPRRTWSRARRGLARKSSRERVPRRDRRLIEVASQAGACEELVA